MQHKCVKVPSAASLRSLAVYKGISTFLPGSSWLWPSLLRLFRFPSALKLLKNHQATQAKTFQRIQTIGMYLAKFCYTAKV